MSVTISVPNKEQDAKCDQWIEMSCEKKNITLRDLYNVCGQIKQQLDMKQQIPVQMGGGELSSHESLIVSWLPSIMQRIKTRVEQGEY